MIKFYLKILIILTLLCPTFALACPKIGPFIDYNCDEVIKIAFTGDSITYGRGDYVNGDQGGFVRRLANQYPEETISFRNIGVPGWKSGELLRGFKKNLNKEEFGITKRRSRDADAIIIKVGVNDWWWQKERGVTPARVVTNIRRLVKFLRKRVPEISQTPVEPFIAVSTLIPAKRESQNAFVKEVNRLLLKYRSHKLPVYIRADTFPISLIDESTVHPTPRGYQRLARTMRKFLRRGMPAMIRKLKLRPDKDKDGVYDYFEENKFFTDPNLADTDGDGYSDMEEIFIMRTDPLDPFDPPVVIE